MMKFITSSVLFATLALSLTSTIEASYSPVRVSLESLERGTAEDVLRQALSSVGMISITNVFHGKEKQETMKWLPACMEESSDSHIQEHVFGDGTRRRTLATHSEGTDAALEIHLAAANHQKEAACAQFQAASQSFRETVAKVIGVFANELAIAFDLNAAKTLMVDSQERNYNLRGIVGQGEHLEHFHCYYNDDSSKNNKQEEEEEETIEWHTDQGLVLAFTPGLVNGETTEGFYIQLADGSTEMVDFTQEDDLVFLLGDGVHQYVNSALSKDENQLRALPHSLQMPSSSNKQPRVWYGRMVLPPASAKHPLHPQLTFGEIREGMLAEDPAASQIGCSQEHMVARELEDTTCEQDASWCWHRCMNHSDYGVSETICADQNRNLACVNDDGFLWPGTHNPDFKLGCALPDAVNQTVTDDSGNDSGGGGGHSGHGDHGGDDKNHTDGGGSNGTTTTTAEEDSTSTLFLGTSMLLGALMTTFFSL